MAKLPEDFIMIRQLLANGGLGLEGIACSCRPGVYRKSDSAILVMKTAKDRSRYDNSEALNSAREPGIFVQRVMNSQPVVISGIRFEHAAQMGLAEEHHVVDTFTSDRSDQSLGEGVLPRRAWGDGLVADAVLSENPIRRGSRIIG
jgi:hypothetical protein